MNQIKHENIVSMLKRLVAEANATLRCIISRVRGVKESDHA
jgi:hypothetical protein